MATLKIKHKLAYAGKGKKSPQLPVDVAGTLTIVQGTVVSELPVYRTQGGVLFAKKELLAALGLKPAQVKELPVIELGEGKKPVQYFSPGNTLIAAATSRALVGQSPVTTFFLTSAFDGHADRLAGVVPEFAEPAVTA